MSEIAVTESADRSAFAAWRDYLGFDATRLKIIAAVGMIVDHIYWAWGNAGAPVWLSYIAPAGIPLFLFLLADSFHYTRNRKQLLVRLLIASWVMIIGSAIITFILPNENNYLIANAFSTLFMSALFMWFYDIFRDGVRARSVKRIVGGCLLFIAPVVTSVAVTALMMLTPNPDLSNPAFRLIFALGSLVPNLVTLEGNFLLAIMGLLFYVFRSRRFVQVVILIAFTIGWIIVEGFHQSHAWLMVLAVIPMLLYNGKPGRGLKNFFYLFYPIHLWIMYIISTLQTMPR